MSYTDFVSGRQAQSLLHQFELDDADNAVASWQKLSNRLKGQLQETELAYAKAEAGRIGFAHLFKTVLNELRCADPTNPLLQKDAQLKVLGAKVAEKAVEMGYLYDSRTGELSQR